MRKFTLFVLLSVQIGASAYANTIHVPADQPTIQAGIDAAVDGDTVIVADGIYTGAGNAELTIAAKQLVLFSQNGSSSTTIDLGLSSQRAFVCSLSTSARIKGFSVVGGNAPACVARVWASRLDLVDCVVTNCRGEQGSLIEADSSQLRIENSVLRKSWAEQAGALSLRRSSANIVDCVFDSIACRSMAIAKGGAIYAGVACSLTVSGTHFRACWATELPPGPNRFGGAIFCDSAVVADFANCLFEHNEASQGLGGAIFSAFSEVTIAGCRFSRNGNELDLYPLSRQASSGSTVALLPFPLPVSQHSGGAIYALLSDLSVYGSVFDSNGFHTGGIQRRQGGAVFLDRTIAKIEGCTFVANEASQGEAMLMANSSLRLDSCIVAFNTGENTNSLPIAADTFPNTLLAISCSNLYGNENGDWAGLVDSLETLYNNFSLDPQFCGRSVGNYLLQEDSPCRPELSPCGSLVGALPVEPGCNSCCEGTTGNANLAGSVDLSDLSLLISYLTVTPKPVIPCPEEGNVNASGSIDLSDLSAMIAYITAGTYTLPWCP